MEFLPDLIAWYTFVHKSLDETQLSHFFSIQLITHKSQVET